METRKIWAKRAPTLQRGIPRHGEVEVPKRAPVTALTRHTVSNEGVIFFFKVIKFIHSYNVKHLTCNIFRSSGLQNIYKLHIWKCSTFTICTLLTKETKKILHIQNRPKGLLVGT